MGPVACGGGGQDGVAPVTPVPATVNLQPASVTLAALGRTQQFTAIVRDQDGKTMSVSPTWTTGNGSVASVATGLVTAIGNGTTTVTARAGNATANATVAVQQAVATVDVSNAVAELLVGATVSLAATPLDSTGHPITGRQTTWLSSAPNVLLVSGQGLVTALAPGTAMISATVDSKVTAVSITVLEVVGSVTIESGNQQAGEVETVLPLPVRVVVRDPSGNPLPNVTFATTVSGGGAVSTSTAVSAPDGSITLGWTLGSQPAVNHLSVTARGVSSADVTATSWRVTPSALTITQLNAAADLSVEYGGQGLVTPLLELVAEGRWLDDQAVLNAASLALGQLVAATPGTASVRVTVAGTVLRVLPVSVTPTGPLVISVSQAGWPADAAVRVRGYRLNDLPNGSFSANGTTLARTFADSAEVRLAPPLADSPECAATVQGPLMVAGAQNQTGATVFQDVRVETLAIGDTRTYAGSSCLQFQPAAGAKYAIAAVERSLIDASASAPEAPFDTSGGRHTYMLKDRVGAPRVAPRAAPRRQRIDRSVSRPVDHVSTTVATDGFPVIYTRATPWQVGDTFTAGRSLSDPTEVTWEVVALYPPNYVLAVPVPDKAIVWKEPVITWVNQSFALVGGAMASVYPTVFGDVPPLSSAGSGQFVVHLASSQQSGYLECPRDNDDVPHASLHAGAVALGVQPDGTVTGTDEQGFVGLMSHELAHAWDCFNLGRTAEARWATEGLAVLMQTEFLRARNGFGVADNAPLPVDLSWQTWAFPAQGIFTNGYSESSPFLRHLALGLWSGHGVSWIDALTTVVRGATEGWHGKSLYASGPGLTVRMQSWDPGWTAVDAMLDWILATAVDDRASGAASSYGYSAVDRIWRGVENQAFANVFAMAFARGTLTSGSGAEVVGQGFPGAGGYVLRDDAAGMGVRLQLSTVNTVAWKVLRYE